MTSCSDSDMIVDQVTENEERGAILRQLNVIANSVALNSETGQLEDGEQFAVDLEYQDHEDGSLLSELSVYLHFTDNTADGVDNSKAEKLIETISASSFMGGDRGLPQYSYALAATKMLSEMGLSSSDLGIGGDQFGVRFEVALTDGRTFSVDDNSGTITGSYFNSPFRNGVTVVCAPTMPTAGTWVFNTTDSYGDGWNGASLSVSLDGGAATDLLNDGSTATDPQILNFEVPAGTSTISIKYNAGAWDSEVGFTITSANGNEVVAVATGTPVAGVELLDYCLGGL